MGVGDGFDCGGGFVSGVKIGEVCGANAGEGMVGVHFCGGLPILPSDEHGVSAGEAVVGCAVPSNGGDYDEENKQGDD